MPVALVPRNLKSWYLPLPRLNHLAFYLAVLLQIMVLVWWFQGGPREILQVLRGSRGSRRLVRVSRVVGILVGLGGPRGPRGSGISGSPRSPRRPGGFRGPRTVSHFSTILLAQVFSCEICKVFKNTFFIQHLRTTASDTKQTSAVATTEFLSKIPNRNEISNEHLNLCEAEISLDEIIRSWHHRCYF